MNTWAPPRKRSVGLLFQIEALEIVLYKNSLKFLGQQMIMDHGIIYVVLELILKDIGFLKRVN
jgi:hypothetical protein